MPLLALTQGLFRHAALRDVALASLNPHLAAVIVQNGSPGRRHPLDPAIARDEPIFLLIKAFALEEPIPVPEHARSILGVNPVDELRALDLLHRITGQGLRRCIDEGRPAVHIVGQHHFSQVLGHVAEAGFAVAKFLLHAAAGGDTPRDQLHQPRFVARAVYLGGRSRTGGVDELQFRRESAAGTLQEAHQQRMRIRGEQLPYVA